jgi:hypothetical protein
MVCSRHPPALAIGSALAIGMLGCHSAATRPNVIDVVLQSMLQENGLQPLREDDAVLCRRMAIDLTGIPPAHNEMDAICHRPAGDIALYFMNKASGPHVPDGSAPYVWVNRRWWADSFQYQSTVNRDSTWYAYVRDLDLTVADLYSGKIGYDVFARRALASPAFARRFGVFESNHDLARIASQAFRVFLGREALPSEAADFGNLWRAWSAQVMTGDEARTLYPDCPTMGGDNSLCAHDEVGLDGTACAGASQLGCQSAVLGPAAVIPAASTFVRWRDLGADQAALEVPGRLIVAQREFAEAAVDRALTKYLGWWKTSLFRPDSDVPAIRDALVKKFVADRFDVRKLELEIVTSLLYTQRAAVLSTEAPTRPLWAHGPTKPLYAEAWLDSIGSATPTAKEDSILIKYKYPTGAGIPALFYANTAQNLGGCPIAAAHVSPSGLVPAVARRVALAQICPGAFVPSAQTTLTALVELEYAGLGRPPSPEEAATWVKYLSDPSKGGCNSAAPAGCDLQMLADQLCASLFATAQANYY